MVLSTSRDRLTVGDDDQKPIVLEVAQVTALQISRGRSRSAGALRGLAWGVPMGLAFGAITSTQPCHDVCTLGDHRKLVRIFAVSGIVWGAGFGALIGRERWEPIQRVAR